MPQTALLRLRVVVPVFDDWESFALLARELDRQAELLGCDLIVSAIDDGSHSEATAVESVVEQLTSLAKLEIVRLAVNVGHQRAIAVGLCRAAELGDADAVLVMDADGEDPPHAIASLLASAGNKRDFCVVAARRKRTEGLRFRASYVLYKTIFTLVTGKKISFGNFSLTSLGYVRRLVALPDLWNNLPAAILRSRLPVDQVSVDRGRRFAGESKMNFTSLVVHGFSAISVYAETIFVRLLLVTIGMMGLTFLAVATVVLLRLLAPAYATPGWATTVSFGMSIILVQGLFTCLMSLLSLLNNRVQRLMLPVMDFHPYVRGVDVLLRASKSSPKSLLHSPWNGLAPLAAREPAIGLQEEVPA